MQEFNNPDKGASRVVKTQRGLIMIIKLRGFNLISKYLWVYYPVYRYSAFGSTLKRTEAPPQQTKAINQAQSTAAHLGSGQYFSNQIPFTSCHSSDVPHISLTVLGSKLADIVLYV